MKRWLKILISYPIFVILTYYLLYPPYSRFNSWYDLFNVELLIGSLMGVVVFSPLLFLIIEYPLKPKTENPDVLDFYANKYLKLLTAGLLGFTLLCGLYSFINVVFAVGLAVIFGMVLEILPIVGYLTIRLVHQRNLKGWILAIIQAILLFFFGVFFGIEEILTGIGDWVNFVIFLTFFIIGTIEIIGLFQLRNYILGKIKIQEQES